MFGRSRLKKLPDRTTSIVPLPVALGRLVRKGRWNVYPDEAESLGNPRQCHYDLGVDDLLQVRGFTVELPTPLGRIRPVNDLSLRIARGESVGLVGRIR